MSRIFISYKRVDKDKVFKIKDQIESAFGERCWIDVDGIESDAVFASKIIGAINNCEVFLFMYSKAHMEISDYENDWTIRELNFAQDKKKRIVFINIDRSELTDWFKLLFGTKQQIDGMSVDKLYRLYNDLKCWLFPGRVAGCESRRNSLGVNEKGNHAFILSKQSKENSNSIDKRISHVVFLSYSCRDEALVSRLYEKLKMSAYKPWMSSRDCEPGKPYAKSITNGIIQCQVFLIFISSSSVVSEHVLNELDLADMKKKIIIPVFIENVTLNDELTYYLARKQWIKVFDNMENFYTINN